MRVLAAICLGCLMTLALVPSENTRLSTIDYPPRAITCFDHQPLWSLGKNDSVRWDLLALEWGAVCVLCLGIYGLCRRR